MPESEGQPHDIANSAADSAEPATDGSYGHDGSPLSASGPQVLVGTCLANRYQLLAVIGEGGMGVVYKARHQLMNRIVAVKLLPSHLVQERSAKRFRQEAEAASKLKHKNIIAVFDFDIAPSGQPFLAMDFLSGSSLADEIKSSGRLPVERALKCFIQVCDGLAHAHGMGVVHRDLKPSNIMLERSGDETDIVRIVDFGIAKIIASDGEVDHKLTQTGELFGSPAYMSPEQCQGDALDCRADIYSLGCVLYESLVGAPPFSARHVLQILHKHLNEMPPNLVIPNCDRATLDRLDAVIFKAMEKSRERRFQSMTELKHELLAIQSELSKGADVGVLARRAVTQVARQVRRQSAAHPKATLSLLVLASCISVLAVFYPVYRIVARKMPTEQPVLFGRQAPKVRAKTADFELRQHESEHIIDMLRHSDDPGQYRLRHALATLADFDAKAGDWAKAQIVAGELFRITKEEEGSDSLPFAEVYERSADYCFQLNRTADAENYYAGAINIREKLGQPHRELYCKFADCLFKDQDYQKAALFYQRALDLHMQRDYDKQSGPYSASVAIVVSRLADCYFYSGNPLAAKKFYREACLYWVAIKDGPERQYYAICLGRLADCLLQLGRLTDAASAYQLAVEEAKARMGTESLFLARLLNRYADVLWRQKKWMEALECRYKSAVLLASHDNLQV